MIYMTPLYLLPRLSKKLRCNIWIKREDLTEFYGNKTRHAKYIFEELKNRGVKTVRLIGLGDSNCMRIYGMKAKSEGMDVIYEFKSPLNTGNGKIMALINQSRGKAFDLHYDGMKEYAALGFIDVAKEIKKQIDVSIDKIYLYSFDSSWIGLCLGLDDPKTEIVNIRTTNGPFGRYDTIEEINYLKNLEIEAQRISGRKINLSHHTVYIDGEQPKIVRYILNLEGVLLDPRYTGRAMKALMDDRKKNVGKNIIFIHTGGIFLNV
jgi:1-aminocyclopropane-1-carboxylate deaminase/D-cysteine desulfhydrase-like pyridoxal-dependent ACC family enzyme